MRMAADNITDATPIERDSAAPRERRLHAPPPLALDRARFRQRPVAVGAGHGGHAVGLGGVPGLQPMAGCGGVGAR